MRDKVSGIREQEKSEGGAFDTPECHIDPRDRKHPISTTQAYQADSRKQRDGICVSAPQKEEKTSESSEDIQPKMCGSST